MSRKLLDHPAQMFLTLRLLPDNNKTPFSCLPSASCSHVLSLEPSPEPVISVPFCSHRQPERLSSGCLSSFHSTRRDNRNSHAGLLGGLNAFMPTKGLPQSMTLRDTVIRCPHGLPLVSALSLALLEMAVSPKSQDGPECLSGHPGVRHPAGPVSREPMKGHV